MRLNHLLAAGAACLCLTLPVSAWTQRSAADGAERLEVRRGQSAVVEADAAFATIVVADPDIAEAMATSNRSFFLRGKQPGTTTVLVYDAAGAIAELIEVEVKLGLEELRADLDRLLPGEPIQVRAANDSVLIEGTVSNAVMADRAARVADSYAPGMSPPSYDKQFVRDHLLAIKWDQKPPGPRLPVDVIVRTQEKYLAALRNLLGP